MKTCNHCGASMNEDDLFCGVCGAKAETPDQTQKTKVFFCPQCGERITDHVTFCPNCGTNISDLANENQVIQSGKFPAIWQSTAASSWKKKLSRIGIALVGVLVVATGIRDILALIGGPSKQFVDFQREFLMEEVVNRLGDGVEKYQNLTDFSTDLTLSAQVDNAWINDYLDDSSLKLSLDVNQDELAASGEVNLMGSDVLTAALEYDKGQLTFALPELDDHCYTMDTVKMLENMSGASDLEPISLPDVSSDALTSLGKAYLNVVLGAANKENVTLSDKKEVDLEVLDQTLKGKTYIFEPTAQDIEAMLEELADEIEEDKDLRSFILSFIGSNEALVSAATGIEDFDEELQNGLADLSDAMRENARDIGESMEDAGFRWIMGVSDGQVCLQRIELRQTGQVFGYESCGDEKEERRDIIYYGYDNDVKDFELEMAWSKDGSEHNGYIVARQYGRDQARFDFDHADSEKESALGIWYGDYLLRIYNGNDTAVFDLDFSVEESKSGGTDHILSVDGLSNMGIYDFNSLDLILHSSDKDASVIRPSGKKIDVTDYSSHDWYELTNNWEDTLRYQIIDNLPL